MESRAMEIDYSLRFFFLSRNAGSEARLGRQDRAAFALDCRLLDLLRARRYSPFGGEHLTHRAKPGDCITHEHRPHHRTQTE